MANLLVERMLDLIDREYALPITLRTMGLRIGRQPAYLGHLFRQQVGSSVREYVVRVRLTHAADLVRDGVKIEAVALCVGYRSKKNFYKQFKRCFGTTPVHYRHGFDEPRNAGRQTHFGVYGHQHAIASADERAARDACADERSAESASDSESILARLVSIVQSSNRAWRLAVRAQQRLLKHLARSRVAMLLTDHAGRYIGANQAAISLIGYSMHELQDLSPADVFVSAPSVDTRCAWQLMLSQFHDSNRPPNARVRQRNGDVANVHLVTLKNVLLGRGELPTLLHALLAPTTG
jgi:PAS domain S-box-containing protein